jgi:hypothetical protein
VRHERNGKSSAPTVITCWNRRFLVLQTSARSVQLAPTLSRLSTAVTHALLATSAMVERTQIGPRMSCTTSELSAVRVNTALRAPTLLSSARLELTILTLAHRASNNAYCALKDRLMPLTVLKAALLAASLPAPLKAPPSARASETTEFTQMPITLAAASLVTITRILTAPLRVPCPIPLTVFRWSSTAARASRFVTQLEPASASSIALTSVVRLMVCATTFSVCARATSSQISMRFATRTAAPKHRPTSTSVPPR